MNDPHTIPWRRDKKAPAYAGAFCWLRDVLVANLLQLEHMFHRVVEVLGNQQRQAQGGDVVALFHGADGLAAHANNLRQGFLGNALLLAKRFEAVVDSVGRHKCVDDGKDTRGLEKRQEWLTVLMAFLKKT